MASKRKTSPWLKETSDRSGFDNFSYDGVTWHKKWTSTKQNGLVIAPDEFDTPPPSSIPLGGSGISGTPREDSLSTAIPPVSQPQVQYITASGGISLSDQPWLMVSGSNQEVNITRNPQISLGEQSQVIAVQCVGSGVILEEGSGLALIASQPFRMNSGSIITFVMSRTDNLWHETSRTQNV